MIFISAGHNSQSKTIKQDPGAVNKHGVKEGDLTIELRDLVCKELDFLGVKYVKDSDEESLAMYLKRIQTGSSSVVCEFHFDASDNPSATGCTALVEADADRLDKAFATDMVKWTADTLGIKNRGVITEAESHRGRLGLMKENGLVVLIEVGFITNEDDMRFYNINKNLLAHNYAVMLKQYEDLL